MSENFVTQLSRNMGKILTSLYEGDSKQAELAMAWGPDPYHPETDHYKSLLRFFSVVSREKEGLRGRIPEEYLEGFRELGTACQSRNAEERATGWAARIMLQDLHQAGEATPTFREDYLKAILEETSPLVLSTLKNYRHGPEASDFGEAVAGAWQKRTNDPNPVIADMAKEMGSRLWRDGVTVDRNVWRIQGPGRETTNQGPRWGWPSPEHGGGLGR